MKQTSIIRTALISLAITLTLGIGFTSCSNEPSNLIIGTWTVSTVEEYLNDVPCDEKIDFNKQIIYYYNKNGVVIKSESINDTYTYTFNKKTCTTTYITDGNTDDPEYDTYPYSIKTVGGENRLYMSENSNDESYCVIETLTKKELVLTSTSYDEDGVYKQVLRFKK